MKYRTVAESSVQVTRTLQRVGHAAADTLSLAGGTRMRVEAAWPDMEAKEYSCEGARCRKRETWELRLLRTMVPGGAGRVRD